MTDTNPWATSTNQPPQTEIEGDLIEGDLIEAATNSSSAWDSAGPTTSDLANGSEGGLNATETTSNLSAGEMIQPEFSWLDPFAQTWIPLDSWVDSAIGWIVTQFRPFFIAIKTPIDWTLNSIEAGLSSIPALLFIFIFSLIAWQMAGKRMAVGTLLGMLILGMIGIWEESITTLSLVLTAVLFCMIIGIPSGIMMARNETVAKIMRPTLDAMQTTPAFVYLVPIVMLFGIGNVPGVVVTIIFAVPPVIRLTNLGIRQVPEDLIEAAHSFGADSKQMLYKVQLPLAMPTIMAGVNQTLMLSLSMVVIASMISVAGLGLMVLRGIGRLDIGLATVGGLGIVILAIILDRMTQSLGQNNRDKVHQKWYHTGPVGLIYGLLSKS